MTLKTQIAADTLAVLLDQTEGLAELCSYLPKDGGGARSVIAVVEEDSEYLDQAGNVVQAEVIRVTVSRLNTSSNHGWIDAPQMEDALLRENDLRAFSFTGEVNNVDTNAWQLTFQRKRLHKQGAR